MAKAYNIYHILVPRFSGTPRNSETIAYVFSTFGIPLCTCLCSSDNEKPTNATWVEVALENDANLIEIRLKGA